MVKDEYSLDDSGATTEMVVNILKWIGWKAFWIIAIIVVL